MRRRRKQSTTVIDLTEPTRTDLDTVRRLRSCFPRSELIFGAPSRCAACSSYGYVLRVDEVHGVSDNRCPSCGTTWRINRKALEAVPVIRPPRPVGSGVLVRDLVFDDA